MQDAFAHCEALVRAADMDRFIAALFAPAEHRGALHALYAFNIEIARVREIIHEPLAGEIRLQWWGDAIAGRAAGDIQSNPVAAALLTVVARYRLPVEPLTDLIAARRFDLLTSRCVGRPISTNMRAPPAGLFALAARILERDDMPGLIRWPAMPVSATRLPVCSRPFGACRTRPVLRAGRSPERHGAHRQDFSARQVTPELRAALATCASRPRTPCAGRWFGGRRPGRHVAGFLAGRAGAPCARSHAAPRLRSVRADRADALAAPMVAMAGGATAVADFFLRLAALNTRIDREGCVDRRGCVG